MKLTLILCLCAILLSCAKEQPATTKAPTIEAPDTLYLEHNGSLYQVFSNGTGAKKIFTGFDAAISNDHTLIAYTEYQNDKRFVAYYDPRSGFRHLYNTLPGDNAYGAQLSPDNKTLLFNHFSNSQWVVARVDTSGNGFTIVTPPPSTPYGGYYQPRWFSDGTGFLCDNLDTVFEFSRDGKLLAAIATKSLVNIDSFGISSSSLFWLDSKRNRYYFEGGSDIDEPPDFAPYAIFTHDKALHKTVKLSPDTIHAMSPMWSERTKLFYFRGYTKREAEAINPNDTSAFVTYSVFSVHEDGTGLKRLFSDSVFKTSEL
jgi:hypothetical protein